MRSTIKKKEYEDILLGFTDNFREVMNRSFSIWILKDDTTYILGREVNPVYINHFYLDTKRTSSCFNTTYSLWMQLVR